MMILHGGGRSPFVRRVALWLILQGRAFERRPVNIFGADFEAFTAFNPLVRVPVLTIALEEHLIETAAIIDYLEDSAAPEHRLIPVTGLERRHCLQAIALANGIAEKGVAFVYETERRPAEYQWPQWRQRLASQTLGGLMALELAVPPSGWMGGAAPNGADIAAVCAYDFLKGTTSLAMGNGLTKLAGLSARANERPEFSTTYPVVG